MFLRVKIRWERIPLFIWEEVKSSMFPLSLPKGCPFDDDPFSNNFHIYRSRRNSFLGNPEENFEVITAGKKRFGVLPLPTITWQWTVIFASRKGYSVESAYIRSLWDVHVYGVVLGGYDSWSWHINFPLWKIGMPKNQISPLFSCVRHIWLWSIEVQSVVPSAKRD